MKRELNLHICNTNENSHVYKNLTRNRLEWITGEYPDDLEQFPNQSGTQNQFFYITTDEDIQEGEYGIDEDGEVRGPYEKCDIVTSELKPIVATNDTTLFIDADMLYPQLSEEFQKLIIQKFNRREDVTKVLVEFVVDYNEACVVTLLDCKTHMKNDYDCTNCVMAIYKIKININNKIQAEFGKKELARKGITKTNITREDFMNFFRDDEKLNELTPDDRIEIFKGILLGESDITKELLNELCSDYNVQLTIN